MKVSSERLKELQKAYFYKGQDSPDCADVAKLLAELMQYRANHSAEESP